MKPLFMWAGGKTRLIKKYKEHLPETIEHYVEPFLGGGAMFVWAYEKNPNAQFVLNDSNAAIMNIYRMIRQDVEIFMEHLDHMSSIYLPLDKDARKAYYYSLRHDHAYNYDRWTKAREAASLYFLMKTGFNGIWQINNNTNGRFGTPAGLLNQKEKVYDKENVIAWSKALKRCALLAGDFGETLSYVQGDSYVFLDPPYRGSFTQYGIDFDDAMQERVVSFLNDCRDKGAYVMMSNRDVGDDFFEQRVGTNKMVYFDVTYTAGRRKKHADGTFTAKKAKEILMIGENNGKTKKNRT